MKIPKSKNQYYGAFIENSIDNIINNNDFIEEYSMIPIEDKKEMVNDSIAIAELIKNNFTSCNWIGRQYKQQTDFICDNKRVELKYVGSGKGTYFNTSVKYFQKYDFNFHDYLIKYGVLDFLCNYFGEQVYQNFSPVNQELSSHFRNNCPNEYQELKEIELKARYAFIDDIFNYLENNNLFNVFYRDMISKNKNEKSLHPDIFIVMNHNSKEIIVLNFNDINQNINLQPKKQGSSLILNNIRITFSWQNGIGLNNPTIRVFLL